MAPRLGLWNQTVVISCAAVLVAMGHEMEVDVPDLVASKDLICGCSQCAGHVLALMFAL